MSYSENDKNTAVINCILKIAVESWRFISLFNTLLLKLDAGEKKRYVNQAQWFSKKIKESLEEINLRIVNIEGQKFDPGMAATPLNIDEFELNDNLIVDKMLEPIIMGKDGIIKSGTVLLRKVEI